MKTLVISVIVSLAVPMLAMSDSASDAELLKSVRALYERENRTKDGRQRWNGKLVSTVIDTNAMTRTSIYENGRVFVDPFVLHTPAAANASLKTAMTTNGVPRRLAAVRARRMRERQAVSNLTVTVTAGK